MKSVLRPRRAAARALLAAVALALAAPAAAQRDLRIDPLLDRLERLERDLGAVQRRLAREGVPPALPEPAATRPATPSAPAGDPADLDRDMRIAELEHVLRQLTDRIERAEFRLRRLDESPALAMHDLEDRIAALEDAAANAPAGPSTGPGAPMAAGAGREPGGGQRETAAPPPAATPEEAYENAYELLAGADYAGAEVALLRFIDNHPEHRLTGNAWYWLGETHYAQQDYQRAAVAFARGYRSFPDGGKAPDNLLKLGMAFAAMGRVEEACTTFAKLRDDHADAPAMIRDRLAGEGARIGCR